MANGAILGQTANTYSKEQIMDSAIPPLYGLGSDAVPSDVLGYIGKYAQHWWKRTPLIATETKTDISQQITLVTGSSMNISYASAVLVDVNGGIELQNPDTVSIPNSGTGATTLAGLAPCYIKTDRGVFYLPNGTTGGGSPSYTIGFTTSGITQVYLSINANVKAQTVGVDVTSETPEYVQSSDRSAYPDFGKQDGYEYQYLGIPFDNAITAPKIATGSYTGTGTYGQNNPNSLTFEGTPYYVQIIGILDGERFLAPNAMYPGVANSDLVVLDLLPLSYPTSDYSGFSFNGSVGYARGKKSSDGKTISWYSRQNAEAQGNVSGFEYFYIAVFV